MSVNSAPAANEIALYVHIPFCQSRCFYCSFVSFAGRKQDIPAYVEAVCAELDSRAGGEYLPSIFIGGGTPSLLSLPELERILGRARALFKVDMATEITLEANPGTVDETYLRGVRSMGVNRLSLGVQSLNDNTLVRLGRIHTASQAIQAASATLGCGLTNLSLDLIYGIPEQSSAEWMDTLKTAVSLGPAHLSLYPLTLEEDAVLSGVIRRGELPPVDPDRSAEQYEAAEDFLATEGYTHYEISNWAREGAQCRHNMAYWQCTPYLGIGAAAHSCMGGHRSANTSDLDAYLGASAAGAYCGPEADEKLTPEIQVWEAIAMGLRLSRGIELADMARRFGFDLMRRYQKQIDELVGLSLLEADGRYLRLTRRGRLLGNEVFWRFLPG